MNSRQYIQICQIILIGLLVTFVNTQQQPAKIQSHILRHATHCKEKVSTDSNIQLRYIAKILETKEIVESKTIELKPGELTIIQGLEQGIQGMCKGEIRRLTVPAALHVASDGQISSKAMIYDMEVLQITSPQILSPTFWLILGSIALAYIIFGKLAKSVDIQKVSSKESK